MKTKHAVITGGAGSVGLATTRMLASDGYTVSVIDRNKSALDKIEQELGESVTTYFYDASKKKNIKEFAGEIIAKQGSITCLVNTVASNPFLPFPELSCDHMHDIVEESLLSYAYTIQSFWENLEPGGSIVNISSVHGTTTKLGNSMYAASKAGVESLTRALAGELREKKVRINAVAPGGFTSEFYRNYYSDWQEKLDKGQIFTPENMASIVVFLLSESSRAINGETIIADGGVFTVRADSSKW